MAACNHPSDVALARRASAGDTAAAEELAGRFGCAPRFLAVQNRRRGNPLDPEQLADATQEVVTIAWQKLATYRGDAALETWVFSICSGIFMNAMRRKVRAAPQLSALGEHEADVPVEDPEPHDFAHVHACIERLGQPDSSLVRARAFDEQGFDLIAARSSQTVVAVKARYYRALRRLRDCLEPFLERER